MKKIFAIALALVMVLSMASAFAACPTINWACDTSVCTDGKGTVEVVPYVKGNACGGNSWTANTCAGAINNDYVYAAIKVTVEANPNLDWWEAAKLEVKVKGAYDNTFGAAEDPTTAKFYTNGNPANLTNFTGAGDLVDILTAGGDKAAELEAGVYYIVPNPDCAATGFATDAFLAIWEKDFEAKGSQLFTAQVKDAASLKFCAYLKSAVDPTATNEEVSVGDYFVKWTTDGKIVVTDKAGVNATKIAVFHINSKDQIEKVEFYDGTWPGNPNYTLTSFGFVDENGKNVGATCDNLDWLAKAMEYLKLDFRATCFTKKAFKANFGWEDKVESCFSWSDKVQSVVDAECVVAIPKTGDASVLAWLF